MSAIAAILRRRGRQRKYATHAADTQSTQHRRRAPAQRDAQGEFERLNPEPTAPAPGGKGWAKDHIIELQHDLTGTSGTRASDYRWQDSAANSREGSQSWALNRNPQGAPAGAVARAGERSWFWKTEGYRSGVRGVGKVLTVIAVVQTGDHIVSAVLADIRDGTMGKQTARAVAEESAGWTGAVYGAAAGAAAGVVCGPAAEICSPIFGLIGGVLGYIGASRVVDWVLDLF